MKLFHQFIHFILKFRISFSILILLLCSISLYQIFTKIESDNALSIWFLNNDPTYKEYIQFQENQGSDEIIVLMIPTENAYSKSHIQTLQNLHQKIDTLKLVNATFSLVKAQYPIFANNKMYLKPVITEKRSLKAINNLLNKLPAIRNNLVADNNTQSFFYIQLKSLSKIESKRDHLLTVIKQQINSELKDYKITGGPILVEEMNKSVAKESLIFALIVSTLMGVLLLIMLPRITYLPIALFAIIIPTIALFGLYVVFGYKLNMISTLIPTILLVYTVSDIIHIMNIYHVNKTTKSYKNKKELIINALQHSLKPCFYTTITTVIGYLALYLSPLPVFKTTGIFTFVGLIIAFIFSYIIAAIGFSFLSLKDKNTFRFKLKSFNYDVVINVLNYITTRYKKTILVLSGIALICGIASLFYVEVNSYSNNLLSDGKAKNDLKEIEQRLKGSFRLSLDIKSTKNASLINDETLRNIEQFQKDIQKNEALSMPISIIDFKSFVEQRYHIKKSVKGFKIDSLKGENNSFFKLVSNDFSRVSINVNTASLGTKDMGFLVNSIEKSFDSIFQQNKNISLKINGVSTLYTKLQGYILRTQFYSFGTAFLLSFFVLFLFIKGLKTSFLALIPNLLPLFLTVIIMAVFNIALEASNAMIAPIMIGIAMDDTIHLIHKYKNYKSQGFSIDESMNKAMLFSGRAVLSTTIVLVLGFSALVFSHLSNIRDFGLLCAVTILFALIADAIVLPALIKTFDN